MRYSAYVAGTLASTAAAQVPSVPSVVPTAPSVVPTVPSVVPTVPSVVPSAPSVPSVVPSGVPKTPEQVVTEIGGITTQFQTLRTAAGALNIYNSLSTAPGIIDQLSAVVTSIGATTQDMAVACASASAPLPEGVAAYKPATCINATDPQGCVSDASNKLALPKTGGKRDAGDFVGSPAAVRRQGGALCYSDAEQGSLAAAFTEFVEAQDQFLATMAQAKNDFGYFLTPVTSSLVVLRSTADTFAEAALTLTGSSSPQVTTAQTSMDAALAFVTGEYLQ